MRETQARGSGPRGAVLRFTRTVMVIDLSGLIIVALGPALVPDRTAEFFAWTIAVPMVAGLIGAGYTAALPSLLWALTIGEWLRVRVIVVAGLALTSLILLFTLRDLSLFHLTEGSGTAIFVGWVWLIAYSVLPPLNIAALVLQERTRAGGEPVVQPLRPITRLAFWAWALVLAVVGALLLFSFGSLEDVWPFGLTRLGAGAIGQWFLTVAVAMAWSARENDWWKVRLLAPFYPLFFTLTLLAAARSSGDFTGGGKSAGFVLAFAVSAVAFALLMGAEERRYRASASPGTSQARSDAVAT